MNSGLFWTVFRERVDLLIGLNADQLKVQLTPNKNTVLHVAAQYGKTQCVKEILQKCGRSLICSVNIKGETSLHISAREGHTDIVQALIEYAKTESDEDDLESGTRVTKEILLRMRNVEGDTALFGAVRNNHRDVVEILTTEDPQFLHFPNNATESPLYLAAERDYLVIVSEIRNNCISPVYIGPNVRTATHAATIRRNKECIKFLHDWKSSLTKEEDVFGWRPLHYAAWHGDVSVVEQLLDLDKSVVYLGADNNNMTPFHIAASQGHIDVMKKLLFTCPDCWEMTNSKGQNILHIAIEYYQNNVICFFLQYSSILGSLLNQKDMDGNTPYHLYSAKTGERIYEFVYHSRVDHMAVNNKNMTPFEAVTTDMNPSQVASYGCRSRFKLRTNNVPEKVERDLTKIADIQMIVATLIATVTFAAGFTIPGGYDGNDGPSQGMAVLVRQTAFKAFVLADTIAMVFSIIAVFLLFFASSYKDPNKRSNRQAIAFVLTVAAMGAMVVTFMTGYYVVLVHSLGLAITVCVICCVFFPIFYYVLKKQWSDTFGP
ncbi:protein ACCELERATED CELL DEATH 6-like [Cornus florida]|uniref:protein ACCELERATED CELL DEATH 6-like n=1 Tax=Cornus florida TaxID=4283 RepID=UPI0028A06681|nr:protein ACCELERATED CELL DEATH 6-like [Cornus florida]